jgi:hypothetical protein
MKKLLAIVAATAILGGKYFCANQDCSSGSGAVR